MSRSKLVPSLFLVAAALGTAACVDDGDSTIVILQNQAPEDGCVVSGAPSETFNSSGTIDSASLGGYVFTPLVKNFAVAAEGDERLRIAFVEGARVEIAFLTDPDFFDAATLADFRTQGVTRFSVPLAGSIDPDATAAFVFEIIPRELLEAINEEFVADSEDTRQSTLLQVSVVMFGSLSSGNFDSQVFRYPVEVCENCGINNLGACSSLSMDFNPTNTGGACNPVQDGVVDCCTDADGLECPAVGTMPPAAQ